ncbi:SH3 domain-containing protein [Amphritea sp.]|uniref:SH3 domain-containing protein n=1 Tax=Amphritea sp. TaxID=1872502 RepID=UPI003A934270
MIESVVVDFEGLNDVKVSLLNSVMLMLLSLFSVAAQAFDYFVVNHDSTVYSAPDNGQALTHLSKGNVLLQIDKKGAWSKVFFLSQNRQPLKGWMLSEKLTAQQNGQQRPSLGDGNRLTVTANSLRLRQGPGTDFPVVGSIKLNQQVVERQRQGDWVKVAYHGTSGQAAEAWTAGRFLRSTQQAGVKQVATTKSSGEKASGHYQVKGSHVNFRSGPGTQFSAVGKLSNPQRVTAIERQNGWLKISADLNGRATTGWMLERLLKPVK